MVVVVVLGRALLEQPLGLIVLEQVLSEQPSGVKVLEEAALSLDKALSLIVQLEGVLS